MVVSASRAIGHELAAAVADLVVFASDAAYVERDVVEAYLTATVGDGRVIVWALHDVAVGFDLPAGAAERIQPSLTRQALEDLVLPIVSGADGINVAGGGRSTRGHQRFTVTHPDSSSHSGAQGRRAESTTAGRPRGTP